MSIKHEFILNDGKAIPWLAIGTGTALYGKDAENAIKQAILAGINHLDGAQTYRNEQSLGAGVVASGVPREKLFITTKLMKVPEGKTVTQTLEESLTKLQTKYVDLFLIHAPFEHEDILAVWKSMEETQKAGLARSIGVSNFRIKDIQVVLAGGSVVPAVNQIEYHPYIAKATDPLVEFCHSKGILVSAYAGLTPITRKRDGPLNPVIATIRERLSKDFGSPVTDGQVLLKWANQRGVVSITTTSKVERIKEYQDVAKLPDLTDDEMLQIKETGYQIHHRSFARMMDEA